MQKRLLSGDTTYLVVDLVRGGGLVFLLRRVKQPWYSSVGALEPWGEGGWMAFGSNA